MHHDLPGLPSLPFKTDNHINHPLRNGCEPVSSIYASHSPDPPLQNHHLETVPLANNIANLVESDTSGELVRFEPYGSHPAQMPYSINWML